MEVIALVGPAGTGKSYLAQSVARATGADAIIDDGLLIQGGKILAGSSAKNEKNKIQAVKRAIFSDIRHVHAVQNALEKVSAKKLLILGTSEAMVKKIAAKLEVLAPSKYINIEDVSNKTNIAKAKESRYKEGKHVVPVPTVELEPHYAGYFIDPFRGFFSKGEKFREQKEKSVIRPTFSMYGKMRIANSAIVDIVKLSLSEISGIKGPTSIVVQKQGENTKSLIINVELVLFYGIIIKQVVRDAQILIKQQLESMTSMSVVKVNMSIKRLVLKNGKAK